jgi:general secretion pathway protein A
MSYIDFFEFIEHPFRITPDVEFYYTSETHSQTYASLQYFVDSNEGFLTLIGEPGTGKTITIRKFLNELPPDVECAYILFPSLEPEDMFKAVLEDFGYAMESNVSKNALFSGFRDFLTEKKQQGKRILLIIDEAQNLPVKTLEELRILSNLETEKEKLIQFILAGQPELDEKLNSKSLRQLKQRITLSTELKFLGQDEVERYVVFRLSKAGYSGQYPDKKFYSRLCAITRGNPRLINLTMERALMSAYLKQSKFLSVDDLNKAAESLKTLEDSLFIKRNKHLLPYILASVIALLLLIIIAMTFAMNKESETAQNTPAQIEKTEASEASDNPAKDTVMQEEPPAEQTPEPKPEPAPEPEPSPEPEPEPAKNPFEGMKTAYVTAQDLNFRSGPTTSEHNIISKLNMNSKVYIKGRQGAWLLVLVESDPEPVVGWVYEDYVFVPEE